MVKTGTRRLDKYQTIFNGFVPKGFGQGIQSPGMGRLWWTMTLQTEVVPGVCLRGCHSPLTLATALTA